VPDVKGYIRQRGDAWQLAVYAGTDDRRRQYAYETVSGTRRQAERRLAELITEVDQGRRRAPVRTTIAALADDWWGTAAPALSPTTRRGYRRLLDKRILPRFGATRVSSLTTQMLDRFYADLAQGRAAGGGPLGPRSVHQIHAVISGMLSTAVRWEWIASSPSDRARVPRIPRRQVHAPEPDVVQTLIVAAALHRADFAAYLRLSVTTGARRGELCALRWSDIDLDARETVIARSIAPDDRDSKLVIEKATKTHQERRIAIDSGTVESLRAHRRSMLERALAAGASYAPDAFVFSDDLAGARPWHPDAVTSTFRRICKRSGVAGVRLHDLRHYHGTMLADLGVPLPSVQERLGHRDLQTTGIYAHGRRATDRVASDLIARHLDQR
jgi:integrase